MRLVAIVREYVACSAANGPALNEAQTDARTPSRLADSRYIRCVHLMRRHPDDGGGCAGLIFPGVEVAAEDGLDAEGAEETTVKVEGSDDVTEIMREARDRLRGSKTPRR